MLTDHEYIIGKVARYIRFMAISMYGEHSALGYFNIDYDLSVSEEQNTYICAGKFTSRKSNCFDMGFAAIIDYYSYIANIIGV